MFTFVKVSAAVFGYVLGANLTYAALSYVEDKVNKLNK